MKKKWFTLLLLLLVGMAVNAQMTLVREGKSTSHIVLADKSGINVIAANLLQRFVKEATAAELPIVLSGRAQIGDVLLGGMPAEGVTTDGYSLTTKGGVLHFAGQGNGTVYGVVSFLERYLSMDYWSDHAYSLPKTDNIQLPDISYVDNPSFSYRQTQNYALAHDSIYKWWYRLEEPSEVFAASYWVHTFNRLLPVTMYGKSHPEYYAFYNGKRHPGSASQWCLTNPNVLRIAIRRIDSIFKAHPDMNIICVSQNDGNNTNCKCPRCAAIDEEEGAYSGSLIRFVNKIAEHFPNKQIATLAYLYTMKPPKLVKPRSNVVVMLCDIDCHREVSLTENKSGQEFVRALEGWSKITNHLFVWDYGINFDNYLSPFPNFHILQDNIRLFRQNHVSMHFSQIASSRGGDFAELRTYLVSKLMWNADANVDSLIHHFLDGYYGKAAPFIYRYINVMEGALIASGKDLWIYDSPVTHKNGMLKPALMRRYNELFDEAEKAVADDAVRLDRVRLSRLPLQYSALEIARTEPGMDVQKVGSDLQLFEERAKYFNVPTLNERSNAPADYCKLYRERYLKSSASSLAFGKKVTFLLPPSEKYKKIGETALTDGLYGGTTFVESWIGWEGTDGAFVVDLDEAKQIHSASTDFLHQLGAWILLPKSVAYSYSTDGKQYTPWQTVDIPENRSNKVLFQQISAQSAPPITARYIKVEITGTKECPSWHYGVGYPSWFFTDEITVN
jgi:uncharacterized C2H2 Zn-finger protein